jgi:hypothetical protein
VSATIGKSLFAKHGKRWNALQPDQRLKYERLAVHARDDAEASDLDQRAELQRQIQEMSRDLGTLRFEDRPMRLANCKFSAEDWVELEALYDSPEFSKQKVDRLREQTSQVYHPPPASALAALQSIHVPAHNDKHAAPEWVRFAVWNRNWCASAVFKIEEPSGSTFWKFVFGKQSPILACMVALLEKPSPDALLQDVLAHDVASASWDFVFEEVWSEFAFSDDGRWSPAWPCFVLPDVVYGRGKDLVADGDWIPFEEVKAMFPELPAHAALEVPEVAEVAPTFDEDVYTRNPWLADYLKWGSDRVGRGKDHSISLGFPSMQPLLTHTHSSTRPTPPPSPTPDQVYEVLVRDCARRGYMGGGAFDC